MSPRSRWIIVTLALVGLVFATASAWVHYKLLTDPAYISPCDLNSRFNCSQVYLSPYGSIKACRLRSSGLSGSDSSR